MEFQDLVRQVGLLKQAMRRKDGQIENLEIDLQTLRTEVESSKQNSGVFSNDALNILVLHVEDFKRHFVTLQMEYKWLERQHEELSDGVKELVATTEEMRSLWPQWRHAIVKVCSIMENRDSRFSSFDIEAEENELDTDVNQVECQQENLEETQGEIHDIESAQMATVQTHQMDANDDPIDLNDLVGSSGSTTGTGRSWIWSQDVET
jgi:DNA repair exonuclease SbcCD ATPase subunit